MEESDYHDLPWRVHEGRPKSEDTPDETGQRQPESRTDFLHDHVAGNLAKQVASVETGVDLVELGALEVEILAHATDIGIVQVGSVKIVDPVLGLSARFGQGDHDAPGAWPWGFLGLDIP